VARFALALVAGAAAASLYGAGPAGASGPALQAGASPCSPAPDGQTCTQTPSRVEATWIGPGVDSLVLTWEPVGIPAGAAAPPSTSAVLNPTAGACTTGGSTTSCWWPWPPSLEVAGTVVNGTYQLQACSSPPSTPCSPASQGAAAVVVAAPGPAAAAPTAGPTQAAPAAAGRHPPDHGGGTPYRWTAVAPRQGTEAAAASRRAPRSWETAWAVDVTVGALLVAVASYLLLLRRSKRANG
jgi:hypothetical protein